MPDRGQNSATLVGDWVHLAPKSLTRVDGRSVSASHPAPRGRPRVAVVGSKRRGTTWKITMVAGAGRSLSQQALPGAEAHRRAKFAKELARSEFGRFYFDERLESLMLQAMRKRRRPTGKDRR